MITASESSARRSPPSRADDLGGGHGIQIAQIGGGGISPFDRRGPCFGASRRRRSVRADQVQCRRSHRTAGAAYFYKVRLSNGVVGYVSKSWTEEVAAVDATGRLALHVLDVGQGDSTLVLCPNGATMLIDAGSDSGRSPDGVRQYLMDAIEPYGTEIDYLIVSHPDADHYNLLVEVLDEVPVSRGFYVGERKDYSDEEVFDWLRSAPATPTKVSASYFDPGATPNRRSTAARPRSGSWPPRSSTPRAARTR